MTSYNAIDGVPCTANKELLTDVLRNQWGFKGFVYSDLISIEAVSYTHLVGTSGNISGEKTILSLAGQVAMSWKDQVFLDVTGRNDWSSSCLLYTSRCV